MSRHVLTVGMATKFDRLTRYCRYYLRDYKFSQSTSFASVFLVDIDAIGQVHSGAAKIVIGANEEYQIAAAAAELNAIAFIPTPLVFEDAILAIFSALEKLQPLRVKPQSLAAYRKELTAESIKHYFDRGDTYKEISEKSGLSVWIIKSFIDEFGWTRLETRGRKRRNDS